MDKKVKHAREMGREMGRENGKMVRENGEGNGEGWVLESYGKKLKIHKKSFIRFRLHRLTHLHGLIIS